MRSVFQTIDPCHAGCSDNALKLTGCSNRATCMSMVADGGSTSTRLLLKLYLLEAG